MIKVNNLSKSYMVKGKRIPVLENINFTVKDNESIALLGRNGAGKSTLIRMLGGRELPDSGSIKKNCSISWPVGYAIGFQGSLSGKENAQFVARIYNSNKRSEIKEFVDKVYDFADIGEYFYMPYKTYSSGMKGRVSFALSLAVDFDVYLLDEVTATGDLSFKTKCKEAIRSLYKKSSFIIATHNLTDLKEYCQRALLIHNKSIIEYSNVEDALNHHKEICKQLVRSGKKHK